MSTPSVPVTPPGPGFAEIVAEIKRVADALAVGNTQIASVIGADSAGDKRVRTDPDVP